MRDKDLYRAILGIQTPWQVADVDLDTEASVVHVRIRCRAGTKHTCPKCGTGCPGYDSLERSWRHLDTCQFRTILVADVPRVKCPEHGVHQINVPWSAPGSRFTALMEALVIDWLKEASISAVARMLHLSWGEVDGIMQRAVARGLRRRGPLGAERIGVDETSFQKRHEYVTVVSDIDDDGRVLHVADGRSAAALDEYWEELSPEELAQLKAIAMDMSGAYISSTLRAVSGARLKTCFDRFHVSKLLNDAVNEVRKQENRKLKAAGEWVPPRTKYLWVQNPENMSERRRTLFDLLRECSLEVGRAWALKNAARKLWSYVRRGWALRAWKRWIAWALRSRLEPMRKAARTIRDHLWGIVNAIVLNVTNAGAEGLNAQIQRLKKTACGYRNRERFRNAIYFHFGGLDLYPDELLTHTKP